MTGAAILPSLIERFFTQRLMQQRNASPHTIASYRDTFRLLFTFAQATLGKPPSRLDLAELDAPFIAAFLDDLETSRSIGIKTRNLRLAAIRSFFRFAALEEPAFAGQIQRVLAIPSKLHDKREVHFLTRGEIDAILAVPDRSTWIGRRDHMLLHLAVQTGLRLSEIVQLERDAITLGPGAHDASLDLDLFGRFRSKGNAGRSRSAASTWELQAVRQMVEAEVARAWIQRATLKLRLHIYDGVIAPSEQLERIVRVRQRAGAATRVEL